MTAKGNLGDRRGHGSRDPVRDQPRLITGIKSGSKGVQKLKMSDYQVKPPSISLLVTSITCTDEIEIHYDVIFAPTTK